MALDVLSLKSVTKTFGTATAASRVDLSLQAGEIFGLVGPNGAGKTTILKMICGLYRPTKGTVRIAGFDITKDPTRAKWHFGYVPDEPAAYDRLSGREFLEFVGALYGMDRTARDARIEALLDRYGLSTLADGAFGEYSRGTQQKISLIAGMLHEPSLLLIDEPMVGLDPESIRITIAVLKEYAADGGAVLVSTHALPVAEALCTRFGVVQEGRLTEVGTRDELRQKTGLQRGPIETGFLAQREDVTPRPRHRRFPAFLQWGQSFLFEKEALVLLRSPSELFRGGMLMALMILSLFVAREVAGIDRFGAPAMQVLLLSSAFFIIGSIAVMLGMRFVYPSVSLEGRKAWVLWTSPIHVHELFSWKLFFWSVLSLTIALLTALLTVAMFGLTLPVAAFFIFSLCCTAVTVVAVTLGQGSMYPSFDDRDQGSLSTTPSGLITTVLCLGYVWILARYLHVYALTYATKGEASVTAFFGVLIVTIAVVGAYWIIAPRVMDTLEFPR